MFRSFWVIFLSFNLASHSYALKSSNQKNNSMRTEKRFTLKIRSELSYQALEQNKEFDVAKESFIQKRRIQLIQKIQGLLPQSKKAPQYRSNLLLRLAALYMDEYHSEIANIHQEYQRNIASNSTKNSSSNKLPYPKLDSAIPFLKTSRNLYKTLLSEFPNHPSIDQIVYSLGVSYLDEGQIATAMSFFDKLTTQYPNSKFRAEALIQLGDHYFGMNQQKLAEAYYDKVIAERKCRTEVLPYVHYKKAWCRYNLGDYVNSITYFKNGITIEETNVQTGALRIRSEVAKDIALPYVELGQFREAELFYRKLGGEHYRIGIESLALLLNEKARHSAAIHFLEVLLQEDPTHPQNAKYELAILDILHSQNNSKLLTERLVASAPIYLQNNSTWMQFNKANSPLISKVKADWETSLRKYALQFHGESQRTKNTSTASHSGAIYRTYLRLIPKEQIQNKMNFNYAELLFRQKQYSEAVDHYVKSSECATTTKEKEEGLRSALISLKNQINLDRKATAEAEINNRGKRVAKLQEVDSEDLKYTETEKHFFKLAGKYFENYSNLPKATELRFELAYLQYSRGDWENALNSFERFIKGSQDSETLTQAAYLVMDIKNKAKDYASLIESCTAFLSHQLLRSNEFKLAVNQVLQQSRLKLIQQLENDEKFAQAAEAYLTYASQGKSADDRLKEKALFNAAVNFRKASRELEALITYEKFIYAYPKSSLSKNVLLELGKGFEGMAKFEKAAFYYNRFAELHKTDASAERALRLAGLYFWAAAQIPLAEKAMKLYISRYTGTKRELVRGDLLELYEDQGNFRKQLLTLQGLEKDTSLTKSQRLIVLARIAATMTKTYGQPLKSFRENLNLSINELVAIGKQNSSAKDAAAQLILLKLKHNEEHRLKQLRLVRYQENIDKKFNEKLSMLADLQKKYAQLTALGIHWDVMGSYQTANAYFEMAEELSQVPPPRSLASADAESYRKTVTESFINPLRNKAKQIAMSCVSKAEKNHVYIAPAAGCRRIALEDRISEKPISMPNTLYLPSVFVSLNWPESDISGIKAGLKTDYFYPYESAPLFWSKSYYQGKSRTSQISSSTLPQIEESGINLPELTSYDSLKGEQLATFNQFIVEHPLTNKELPTFNYLIHLKTTHPGEAIRLIKNALEKDPKSFALHNLLALSYLDLKQFGAAKVTWLALKLRGFETGELYNNLGVLSVLQGNQDLAHDYFIQASESKNAPASSYTNLGFMALKAWIPNQAEQYFQKARELEKSITLDTALAVVKIQQGNAEQAKSSLLELAKQHPMDNFIRQSLNLLPAEMTSSETLSQVDLQKDFELESEGD